MIGPSHSFSSSVPPFHPLGNGTVEHGLSQRNTPWNVKGTFSLKALADKVLERNKERNKRGTIVLIPVPRASSSLSACGTNAQGVCDADQRELLYMFNERAAIRKYDAGFPREEAERLTRIDIEANQTIC